MTDRVFQLVGTCNSYPWGKTGRDSIAAQLCAKTDSNFSIQHDKPYSELWFGDYPDFPARLLSTGEPLQDVIDKNKDTLLGKKTTTQLGGQLPYLPKVAIPFALSLPIPF